MLRNSISFIFKLGKHPSLPFQPLRQFSHKTESPASSLPSSQMMLDAPAKIGHPKHSNQMSS